MKSIELAKTLQQTFAERGASSHKGDAGVDKFDHGSGHTYAIRDLSLSRQIQLSKSFSSFNYFAEGVERLEQSGRSVAEIKGYYEDGLLFREGDLHREDKRMFGKLLVAECREMERLQPRIEKFVSKRKSKVNSALDFSELITRLCVGVVVSNLTSAPLTASMRALRQRANVFYYHFHPLRQQQAHRALSALHRATLDGHCERVPWLLAQSLIVMGYDPLVGTLCAALLDDGCDDFAAAPSRYCATSFVARICDADTSIDGYDFKAGDICYLSLVPAVSDTDSGERSRFPFGLGIHTCVAKPFSIAFLKLAQEVAGRCFPDGFDQPLEPYGDGAFLMFRPSTAVHG